jgi:sporulation protein YlmC with PRC-barrel domain
MEYPLNVDVHCTDGRCGRSTYIVLNPATEQVTHIVVREKQPSRVERLVPVRLIAHTAAEVILLDCTTAVFASLEPFNQTEFIYTDLPHHARDPSLTALWPYVVPAKRIVDDRIRPIPPGELAVHRGTRVHATDGRIGRVDEFVVDPETGYISHLCMREGHVFGDRRVCIPVSEIERIGEKAVHLKISKAEVEALQPIPIEKRW